MRSRIQNVISDHWFVRASVLVLILLTSVHTAHAQSVACWGLSDYGQCDVPGGVGTPANSVVQVAAGYAHAIAVLEDGSVAFWGNNDYSQCDVPSGVGTPENPILPVTGGGSMTAAIFCTDDCVDICVEDLNDDEVVNGADLAYVLGYWGTADPLGDVNLDVNLDGNVDAADLGLVLTAWVPCTD